MQLYKQHHNFFVCPQEFCFDSPQEKKVKKGVDDAMFKYFSWRRSYEED